MGYNRELNFHIKLMAFEGRGHMMQEMGMRGYRYAYLSFPEPEVEGLNDTYVIGPIESSYLAQKFDAWYLKKEDGALVLKVSSKDDIVSIHSEDGENVLAQFRIVRGDTVEEGFSIKPLEDSQSNTFILVLHNRDEIPVGKSL